MRPSIALCVLPGDDSGGVCTCCSPRTTQSIRRSPQPLLNRRGHSVVVVGNGRLAVERTQSETFDVVLMDLQMPEMDGWDAIREIRERDRGRGVYLPIIALTAHAMSDAHERCLAAGMDSVVVKPFDPVKLYGAIEQAMSKGYQALSVLSAQEMSEFR